MDGWRDEQGVARIRAADPILSPPELARRTLLAADAVHEFRVHLADQTLAQRGVWQTRDPTLQRTYLVEDFALICGLDSKLRLSRKNLAEA